LTILIETHYLPCIAWFAAVSAGNHLKLEKHEHFVKQTYRNRCYINTEHGLDSLHVPVLRGHGKTKVSDVRIDHTQKWVMNHWRSVTSAYGKAPFFEYYADDLRQRLLRKNEFLYDLNVELLTLCLKWLRLDIPLTETMAYEVSEGKEHENNVRDLRNKITDRRPEQLRQLYRPVAYTQVFGNAFAENASVIDLIFCCGPEAGRIVKASQQQNEQIRN
jgi:hypothetical protein